MGRSKRKIKKQTSPYSKKMHLGALDKTFDCPFCEGAQTCEVRMDYARHTAKIFCTRCREDFQTTINKLSQPVDVHCDWIDACDSVNNRDEPGVSGRGEGD